MKLSGLFKIIIAIVLLTDSAFVFAGCMPLTLPVPEMPSSSKIYDVNGKLVSTIFKENRTKISIKEIPTETQNAFLAVEDVRFYKHFGLDPIRIVGAAWKDIKAGELVEGGSTITQQTAKNLYLTREKTFGRKFTEAWLAIQLERRYTKREILEMYLNQIYFGRGAYGIETAAQIYFNKSASRLDLAESAMLAGLPKAPNTYSPFENWEGAKNRQKLVLKRMTDVGYITEQEKVAAINEKLVLNTNGASPGNNSYFINEVLKYITDNYENGAKMLFSEGISVYTTINADMQKSAEKAFKDVLANKNPSLEGALVAIDPSNGYINAMVGGRNFAKSMYNRAILAKRQPGSAFKPFLYTAAIDKGYTQGSIQVCEPTEFPQYNSVYKPTDYGSTPYHNRPFTLREAIAVSDNIVAVKLTNELGPDSVVEYAHKMGIAGELRPYLSIALGTSEVSPLEITSAYCTLASMGIKTKPMLVLKVVDKNGRVLEENIPKKERVIPETTAYLVTDMLTGVLKPGGTAVSLTKTFSAPAAGKTGTTQEFRDAWFVGYTPGLVAGVYIGYDNPAKSVGIPGGKIAGPIWAKFMAGALKDNTEKQFPVPQGIVKVQICSDSGQLATPSSPKTLNANFLEGTEPTQFCGLHSYPEIDQTVPGEIYNNWFGNQ
jgi:1A family penicillin-binding protein